MTNKITGYRIIFFAFWLVALAACNSNQQNAYTGWPNYGGSKDMIRYSSLTQIDTNNVYELTVAWAYHTGDADTVNHSQIQCNPIMVDGILYGVGPQMKLFAIDAATGKEKWVFDANAKTDFDANRFAFHIMINSRGVAYWTDGKDDKRIFFTAGSNTYAIDANTGKPISSFADSGYIDLHNDLGRDVHDLFVVATSPGIIYKDLLIIGARVDEAPPSAPGHIRAYDVRTGKLKWIFHTIPQPGEYGFDTWQDTTAYKYLGGANPWSGFSLDERRGILFAATGSAAYDFYGGKRKGANLFANCLIAIDAATGKRIWHFQFMHHDLWDKDLPTPPALVTINKDGKKIDAVAQPTKNGMVYVFERETGKPVFEINEVPADTVSELAGEQVWPTQPIPVRPAPFVRQTLTADDINPYMPDSSRKKIQALMKGYRYGKMNIPPGKTPTLVFPGYDGGAEWGGPAFDPATGIMYINANEMVNVQQMVDNKPELPKNENYLQAGQRIYMQTCMTCHGDDKKGRGNTPTLIDVNKKYNEEQFVSLINSGRRMMPAFNRLADEEKKAIASFVLDLKNEQQKQFIPPVVKIDSINIMPYKMTGYTKFLTPEGYPAIIPPWGTLNAIDLNTGELVWKTVLGEYEELTAKGIPRTGTENYGGPVVTAGGVVFIAATRDGKIRGFNKTNGKLLWEYKLPAPGFATPAMYELNGKQYLVIACGGGKLGTKASDAYLAFALPGEK
ncbi:MAG TPA: PQQ-binding-like beta-propeller repeat protein [Panacibacter sp.]|nr:PQQ-binding-like beta-propeller repeat protein [Panacibacter sp.]HNP43471.1 PQQ-binding-like beta-propeller repeat protein [Panacibacter sp.]